MKNLLSTIIYFFLILTAFSQTNPKEKYMPKDDTRNIQRDEYEKFLGQILATNDLAVIPSVVVDMEDDPSVKVGLPVYPFFKRINESLDNEKRFIHYVSLNGKIGAKSGFSSLFNKGEWLPDAEAALGYTWLCWRYKSFYSDEITPQSPIGTKPISEAARIGFIWLNLKGGYNYSTFGFYNDAIGIPYDERLTDKTMQSGFVSANLNTYFYPSRRRLGWFTLYSNIGIEYRVNDNNYSLLKKFSATQSEVYKNPTTGQIDVVTGDGVYRKGTFQTGNSFAIPFSITGIVSSTSKKFYVGLTVFSLTKWMNNVNTTNLGIALNVPIQKSDDDDKVKTVANFALRTEFQDAQNNASQGQTFKERMRIGFTVGIPFPSHQ